MTKTFYLGLNFKKIELVETCMVSNFKAVYSYASLAGKPVKLRAWRDCLAYGAACDFRKHPDPSKPAIKAGTICDFSVLENGYSSHDFEAIEV